MQEFYARPESAMLHHGRRMAPPSKSPHLSFILFPSLLRLLLFKLTCSWHNLCLASCPQTRQGWKVSMRNEEREPVCITRCTISPPFLLQSFFPSSVFPRPDFCLLGGQCRIEEEGEHLSFTLYLGNQQVYNRKIKYLSITFTQHYQSPF